MSTKENPYLEQLISNAQKPFGSLGKGVVEELSTLLNSEFAESEMNDTAIKQIAKSIITRQLEDDVLRKANEN